MPDIAKMRAIKGEVVAVGRGKWHPGEWWCVKGKWEWFDGWREEPPVSIGQNVFFGSRWNDIGEDYQEPDAMWDDTLHYVQIADIYGVVCTSPTSSTVKVREKQSPDTFGLLQNIAHGKTSSTDAKTQSAKLSTTMVDAAS